MAERKRAPLPPRKKVRGLLGLRISKRSYIFNIRRRFDHMREFKVEQKPQGIEAFRQLAEDRIRSLMKFDAGKMARVPRIPRSPAVPKGVLIGLAFLLIFVVGALAYFMLLLSTAPPLLPPQEPGGSSLSLSPISGDVAWYGRGGLSVGLASVLLSSENVSRLNISLSMYDSPVPRRIVLVKTSRAGGEAEEQFSSALGALLGADGSVLETIYLDQLRHAPPSFAVYIISSDFMPAALLGLEGGKGLVELTKRGGVVFFAGFSFTDALSGQGGIVPVPPDYLSSEYGLSFRPASGDFEQMRARNPLYTAGSSEEGSFMVNGQVLMASFEGRGSAGKLVIIPQTLSGGWKNATAAAGDFFGLIRRASWLMPLARGSKELRTSAASASGPVSLTTSPMRGLLGSSPHPYLLAEVTDNMNRSYLRSLSLPPQPDLSRGGTLFHDPVAFPTALTGRKLTLLGSNLSPVSVAMELQAYSGGKLVSTVPMGTWLSLLQYDYDVTLAPGDYVLKLVDTQGILYAKSYLRVPELSLEKDFFRWDRGTFRFLLLADGAPFEQDILLSNVQASLDGRKPASLTLERGVLTFQSAEAPLPAGTYAFEFDFGTSTATFSEEFSPPRNWWDETEYRLGILAIVVLFFLGYAIRKPDVEKYSLDVPDFPPLSKIAIPVKRQTVLGLFDSVNREYKWKYMPLKISELKSGFRKILHKGKGIVIGDYNTERIMDQLVQEGRAKKVLGMYVLSDWEAASGRSVRYLAIFRKMRDVLVNNAMRFEELNSSKDCDTVIGLGGGTMVHIYEPTPVFIRRVLAGSQKQRQLLLFANDAEKMSFEESLDSTSQARMMVKMLISAGRLSLVTVDELDSFVKKTS